MANIQALLRLLFCISLLSSLIKIHHAPVFRSKSLIINDITRDSIINCYHQDASYIGFTVELRNGTVVDRSTNSDIIYQNCHRRLEDSSILLYTVTIPSQPVFYGAQIICNAVFDNQLDSSQNITLTLTTTSRRTLNVPIGAPAVFECASCSGIEWKVNDTDLNRLLGVRSKDITTTSRQATDSSITISTLTIIGQSAYNGISVECLSKARTEQLPSVSLFVDSLQCQENLILNQHLMVNSDNQIDVVFTAYCMNSSTYHVSDIAVVKLDSLDDMNSIQFHVALSFSDQTLSLMLSVPRQRIWNCTVVAYCISSFELNTHDIQNITVSSPLPGQVRVTGDSILGSTSTDVLTILYRRNDSHVFYDLFSTGFSTRNAVIDITGVDGGAYDVFVFAVEGNGTYSMATVKPQFVIVDPSNEHPPSELPKIKYDIERKADGFKVTCISLDPSVDNCVVVGHQRLPVDNHLDITLYVYQLGSVGDITSGYIYVANPEDYQIAVIGGTRKARKPTSNTKKLILFLLFCLLVIPIVIVAGFKKLKKPQAAGSQPRQPVGPADTSQLSPQPAVRPEGGSQQPPQPVRPEQPQPEEINPAVPTPNDGQSPFNMTTPREETIKDGPVKNRKEYGPLPRVSRPIGGLDSGDGPNVNDVTVTLQPYQQQMDIEPSSVTL